MVGDNDDPIYFSACFSINTAIIVGGIALLSSSTILYSMAFTAMIVGFVTGSIHLLHKK